MDRAGLHLWAAFGFQWAIDAFGFKGPVFARFPFWSIPSGIGIGAPRVLHLFTAWTDIAVVLIIPGEVGSRERSIRALTFVEDGDEGEYLPLQCQPNQIVCQGTIELGIDGLPRVFLDSRSDQTEARNKFVPFSLLVR